jgi:hypothetical protein
MRVPFHILLVPVLASACGSEGQGSSPPPRSAPAPTTASTAASTAEPASVGDPKVSTELRHRVSGNATCEAGDVCGYFLQIVSPGSEPEDLAKKAVRMIKGKCGGHVVVYKDPRGVMGAGTVLATAEEKRACEKALEREEDKDFPSSLVMRVIK